jgi:hypothetical protein
VSDNTDEPVLRRPPNLNTIRIWGRENGWDVPERGKLPTGLREAFKEANPDAFARDADGDPLAEIAPRVEVERTPVQRAKGFLNRQAKKTPAKKVYKRVSTENIIEGVWSILAMVAKPISQPAARALILEAPVAGMILDEKIRGTLLDKALQPLARTEDSGKSFVGLLAPPLLVAAIEKRPDQADKLFPLLRKSLVWHAEIAGPKLEERMKKEQEIEDKYGQDIDAMIMTIFGAEMEDAEE